MSVASIQGGSIAINSGLSPRGQIMKPMMMALHSEISVTQQVIAPIHEITKAKLNRLRTGDIDLSYRYRIDRQHTIT
jgi:hypothetical protein